MFKDIENSTDWKSVEKISKGWSADEKYLITTSEYVSGEEKSDNEENNEVIWMNVKEALAREDVPEPTKKLVQVASLGKSGLQYKAYESTNNAPYSLYCVLEDE